MCLVCGGGCRCGIESHRFAQEVMYFDNSLGVIFFMKTYFEKKEKLSFPPMMAKIILLKWPLCAQDQILIAATYIRWIIGKGWPSHSLGWDFCAQSTYSWATSQSKSIQSSDAFWTGPCLVQSPLANSKNAHQCHSGQYVTGWPPFWTSIVEASDVCDRSAARTSMCALSGALLMRRMNIEGRCVHQTPRSWIWCRLAAVQILPTWPRALGLDCLW